MFCYKTKYEFPVQFINELQSKNSEAFKNDYQEFLCEVGNL